MRLEPGARWRAQPLLQPAIKARWPRGCRRRKTQGIRWAIGLLMWFSTQPHAVIIGYSILRRFEPLLILQGLMFMKITFRDRAVILQPIHPYLITKIYSMVSLSGPHLCLSFSLFGSWSVDVEVTSRCSCNPHRAENQLWISACCQSWRADLCPPKALNHLAQWVRVWAEPTCPTVPCGRDNWVKQVVLHHTNVQERQERGELRKQHGLLLSDRTCEACTPFSYRRWACCVPLRSSDWSFFCAHEGIFPLGLSGSMLPSPISHSTSAANSIPVFLCEAQSINGLHLHADLHHHRPYFEHLNHDLPIRTLTGPC